MNQAEHTMNSVLEPISVEDFFEQYWEQKPLHISRSNSAHFSGLLKIADIESALSTQRLRFPQAQLTQSGKAIPAREYTDTDDQIMPDRFVQQHLDGATIVLSQANTVFEHLAELCRNVHSELQLNCQANVYLSPAGNQGFNAHYDTHDVFILQLSGCKSFNFYKSGVKLPRVHDAFDPALIQELELTETVDLRAGDSLYIPRGMVHDAIAQDETSLHITLGVFAVVLSDLLTEMVQLAAEGDTVLRSSIPRGMWMHQPEISDLESIVLLLKDKLQTVDMNAALSRMRDDVAMNGVQSCHDLLSGAPLRENINGDSCFDVNEHIVMSCERQGSTLHVRAIGKVMEFTEPLSCALEWILNRDTFCVNDVPGLSEPQQTALLDRLMRENIVSLIL